MVGRQNRPPVIPMQSILPFPPAPMAPEPLGDSDPGNDTSSNPSIRLPGRRISQAHCVWLGGKPSDVLQDTLCQGGSVKPSTLMYDDWFIQHGERVRSANFPLVAELRTQHRLDYAGHKRKYKCTHLGCWRKVAPTPTGEGLECTLHAEVRLWGVSSGDWETPG